MNLIACGLYVSLLFAGLFLREDFSAQTIQLALYAVIVIAIFAFSFNYWRYLAIAKAPVSTIAAAAQGYVELNGIASRQQIMISPLHNVPCVWHRSWTYARGHKNMWRLVDYQQSTEPFQLTDDTGACTVEPQGAEVIHMLRKTKNQHNHRYVEEFLRADKSLYLIGHLDTRHHFVDQQKIKKQMGEVISEWKSKPRYLLSRFDQDRDGEIDLDEWEHARAEARNEVERANVNQAHLGDFVISAPDNGQLYILSGKSPQALRSAHRNWVLLHLTALLCLFSATQFY